MFFKVSIVKRSFAITSVIIFLLCVTTACGRKGPDAPPDKTPPEVIATNPALGSVDVPSNTAAISVTFSELVDAGTISFLLVSAGTVTVPCTMIYSDKTAVFTPSNALAYNTQYFATIRAGVTDMLGNVMPGDYPWIFTTGTAPDTTPPAVLPDTLVPAGNATNVLIFPIISVTFSEPVNPSTVNSGTVKVNGNGAEVPGTVTLDFTGTKAIFTLSGALAYNTTYTVTIVAGASGVKDMAGNALAAEYSWSFKTAPQPPYTITASAGANGTISPAGSVGVNSGASQQFTITPNTGYLVANVLVDGVSVGAVTTYIFTNITANHTIAASFSINTFSITFVSGGNGTLTGTTSQTVSYGGSATAVTAVPSTGYQFVNWTGTGGFVTSTTNPLTVTNVTAAQTITANFAINTYSINFLSGGNGTLTGTTSQTVSYGGSASAVTAVPSTGYQFVNWTGTGGFVTTTSNPLTVTNVTATQTITANFATAAFAINFVAGSNGTLTGTTSQTVSYGGSATAVTAVPSTGYHFVNWTGTGGFVTSTTNPLTVTNVTAAQTITANFAINTFTITFVSGGNGTLTGTTIQTVSYGGSATAVTAVPSTGYQFVNWTGTGGFVTSTTNPLTVTNVTAAQTITANFVINTFTVTPSVSGGNGTISPSTPQTVNYNTTTSFTLSPSTGYHAVMSGTCVGTLSGDGLSYTTNAVTADCTVVASFTNQYTLTVTIVGPGSVTSNPAGINCGSICSALYVVGTPVDLSATPNGSHVFNGWSGDCSAFGTTNPASVLMDGDRTCTATFGN